MTHIAITGVRGAKNVEGMEKVSDEQYKAGTQEMIVRTVAIAMVALSCALPMFVHAHEALMPKPDDISRIAPGLDKYSKGPLSDLWKRPQLSPRDRSVVTLAGLIARNQTIEMPQHLRLALDNGVKPSEISEIITHLAFYSGRANALSAIVVTQNVAKARGWPTSSRPWDSSNRQCIEC